MDTSPSPEQNPERTAARQRKPPTRRAYLGAAASTAVLAGCTGALDDATTTTSSKPEDVRATAAVPLTALPVHLARRYGYLEERGISVSFQRAISGAKETPKLASGQIDATLGSIGASTINAIARGIPMKIVAPGTMNVAGVPSIDRFLVRTEQYDDGMDVSDVEGMTVAGNAEANVVEYEIGLALAAHGLSFDDVEYVTMPFPQMISAFQSGSIDVANEVGSLSTAAIEEGVARHLEYASETSAGTQVAAVVYGEPFVNQRPDTARKFMEAYLLGVRKYYELGPWSDPVVETYGEAAGNSGESLRSTTPLWVDRNGSLATDSIMQMQEFFACRGHVDETLSEDELVDARWVNDALETIGRVDEASVTPARWREMKSNAARDFAEVRSNDTPDSWSC